MFRRSLAIFETLGPEHSYVAASLNNLALLLFEEKKSCRRRAPVSQGPDHLRKRTSGRGTPPLPR